LTLNYGISILQSRLQQYKTIGFTDYSVGIYFAHSITWCEANGKDSGLLDSWTQPLFLHLK